jgi:hypothetical protein
MQIPFAGDTGASELPIGLLVGDAMLIGSVKALIIRLHAEIEIKRAGYLFMAATLKFVVDNADDAGVEPECTRASRAR